MTARRYYDQNDSCTLEVDSNGPDDNNVLFTTSDDGGTVSLNKEQIANLIQFLQGEAEETKAKVLWSDV